MSGSGKPSDTIEDERIGESKSNVSAGATAKSKGIVLTRNPLRKILYYTHNWVGLLTTAYLFVFLLTGVLLNHDIFSNLEQRSEERGVVLNPEQKAAAQEFWAATQQLTAAIAKYTKRPNFETIHIQRDGQADYLDHNSPGHKWTFYVKPDGENMVWSQAHLMQPWYFMNELHVLTRTHPTWAVVSTVFCVLIFVVLLSGVLLLRWKKMEIIMLLAGVALLLICSVTLQSVGR